jgi:hypothetical protein
MGTGMNTSLEVSGPDGQKVPFDGPKVGRPPPQPSKESDIVLLRYRRFLGYTRFDLCEAGAYHLRKSGTYRVRWTYSAPGTGETWGGQLISNEVQFEFVGEKPPQSSVTGKAEQTQTAKRVPHGEVKDGLAAFLTCPGVRFKVGQPVPLDFGVVLVGAGLESESDAMEKLQLRVWRPTRPVDPLNISWLLVTGPDGQNVPYHGVAPDYRNTAPLNDEFSALLHHRDLVGRHHPDLRKNYDLSRPGTYNVQWGYAPFFRGGPWTGKLMSNEVKFEIAGDDSAEAVPQMPSTTRERRD